MEIEQDSVTNSRRYQIHRTPGTNNQESWWLRNADELESWLMVKGACKDERWNLEVTLSSTASLIFIDRMRSGGKRIYRYTDGTLDKTSDWLSHGAHLGEWLKEIGARFVEPEPQLPPGATCEPVEQLPESGRIAEMEADLKKLEAHAAMCRTFETEKLAFPPMFAADPPAAEAVVDADTGELIPREIDGFVIHQRAKDGVLPMASRIESTVWEQVADGRRQDDQERQFDEIANLLDLRGWYSWTTAGETKPPSTD